MKMLMTPKTIIRSQCRLLRTGSTTVSWTANAHPRKLNPHSVHQQQQHVRPQLVSWQPVRAHSGASIYSATGSLQYWKQRPSSDRTIMSSSFSSWRCLSSLPDSSSSLFMTLDHHHHRELDPHQSLQQVRFLSVVAPTATIQSSAIISSSSPSKVEDDNAATTRLMITKSAANTSSINYKNDRSSSKMQEEDGDDENNDTNPTTTTTTTTTTPTKMDQTYRIKTRTIRQRAQDHASEWKDRAGTIRDNAATHYREFREHPAESARKYSASLGGMLRLYGPVFVATYFGVYLTTLATLFTGIESGYLDPVVLFHYLGHDGGTAGEASTVQLVVDFMNRYDWTRPYSSMLERNPTMANFAVAWIAVKFTEPIRLPLAVALTPRVANAVGWTTPKSEEGAPTTTTDASPPAEFEEDEKPNKAIAKDVNKTVV